MNDHDRALRTSLAPVAPHSALIRVILETRWGGDEWPIVKAELRKAVKERSRLERAGWFN